MFQADELCRQWSWSVDSICKLLVTAAQCLTELATSPFDSKFIKAQLHNQWLPWDLCGISAIDITHPYRYEHRKYSQSQRTNLLCDSLTHLMLKIEGGRCRTFNGMADWDSLDRETMQLKQIECNLSNAYECSMRDRPVMTIEQRFITCLTKCLCEEDEIFKVLIDEINCNLLFRVEMHPKIDQLHQRMNHLESLRSKLGSTQTLHTLRDIETRIVELREIDDLMLRLCHNLSLTYPKIRDLCRSAYCAELVNNDPGDS